MKIRFERIDDARHRLTVDHDTAVCETKSLLLHDFLHYAIEKEAGLETGFWGTLASGRTFAELRQYSNPDLAVVEKIVGALHPSTKGWRARDVVVGLLRFMDASGEPLPGWVDEARVAAAQERLRRMVGEWNATGALALAWP